MIGRLTLNRMAATPSGWTHWILFAGYVVAAALCFTARRAWTRSRLPQDRRIAALWLLTGACLSFLALNRALGLDAGLTTLFRSMAMREGWYADRRALQLLVVLLLAVGVVVVLLLGRRFASGRIPYPEVRIVLVATVLLLGFVAIRACSFHYLDEVLGRTLAGFRVGGLAEFAAILSVAVSALLFHRRTLSVDRVERN